LATDDKRALFGKMSDEQILKKLSKNKINEAVAFYFALQGWTVLDTPAEEKNCRNITLTNDSENISLCFDSKAWDRLKPRIEFEVYAQNIRAYGMSRRTLVWVFAFLTFLTFWIKLWWDVTNVLGDVEKNIPKPDARCEYWDGRPFYEAYVSHFLHCAAGHQPSNLEDDFLILVKEYITMGKAFSWSQFWMYVVGVVLASLFYYHRPVSVGMVIRDIVRLSKSDGLPTFAIDKVKASKMQTFRNIVQIILWGIIFTAFYTFSAITAEYPPIHLPASSGFFIMFAVYELYCSIFMFIERGFSSLLLSSFILLFTAAGCVIELKRSEFSGKSRDWEPVWEWTSLGYMFIWSFVLPIENMIRFDARKMWISRVWLVIVICISLPAISVFIPRQMNEPFIRQLF
jgi:hypothetical protein